MKVQDMTTTQINHAMKKTDALVMEGVLGQRYLGNAFTKGSYELHGYAGNGFASFLNGAHMTLYGNAQEACADTMSSGLVCIHGNCGDALAYGMRGGQVFVSGNCGARCGIHMKEYQEETLMVIGGTAKSFLGEYVSGGTILVLNQELKRLPVGRYCGIGAHGGAIYARVTNLIAGWEQVDEQTLATLQCIVERYCQQMSIDPSIFHEGIFIRKCRSEQNPYEGLYIDDGRRK